MLLLGSRALRSIAGGALGVITGLYLYYYLHLSLLEVGVFFGVGAFTVPVLSLVFGKLGDKFRRKPTLILASSFLPAATLILLTTRYYPLLLLAAALGGFGTAGALASGSVGAIVAPIQTALLADKTEDMDRTTVYSIFNLVSGLGSAGGALLAYLSYIDSFVISLILSLLALLLIVPIRDEYKPQRTRTARPNGGSEQSVGTQHERGGYRADLIYIRRFAVVGALNGTAQGLVTPFLSIIFRETLHVSNGVVGSIFFIGGVAAALASLMVPWLSRALGLRNAIIVPRAISTAALIMIPFVRVVVPAVITYMVYVMFRVASLPPQQVLMMELVSRRSRSTVSGVNQAARLLPSAVATTFTGFILNFLPMAIPFEVATVMNIINMTLYGRFFPNPKPRVGGAVIVGD